MEEPQRLVYHTFFAEFRGETPEDVVQALYKDSATVTGQTYPEWWAYQKHLWSSLFVTVPEENQVNACKKLLEIMVNVRALELGPRPVSAHRFTRKMTYD